MRIGPHVDLRDEDLERSPQADFSDNTGECRLQQCALLLMTYLPHICRTSTKAADDADDADHDHDNNRLAPV